MRRRDVLVAAGGLAGSFVAVAKPTVAVADVAAMVKRYGRPDVDASSANEKPRPPMVTRRLEYKKAGVVWVLLADAPFGAPPPYKQWLLMGAQDLKTLKKISVEEAETRILNARKKG